MGFLVFLVSIFILIDIFYGGECKYDCACWDEAHPSTVDPYGFVIPSCTTIKNESSIGSSGFSCDINGNFILTDYGTANCQGTGITNTYPPNNGIFNYTCPGSNVKVCPNMEYTYIINGNKDCVISDAISYTTVDIVEGCIEERYEQFLSYQFACNSTNLILKYYDNAKCSGNNIYTVIPPLCQCLNGSCEGFHILKCTDPVNVDIMGSIKNWADMDDDIVLHARKVIYSQ